MVNGRDEFHLVPNVTQPQLPLTTRLKSATRGRVALRPGRARSLIKPREIKKQITIKIKRRI